MDDYVVKKIEQEGYWKKRHLFAVGCCLQYWSFFNKPPLQQAVITAENWLEGQANDIEMEEVHRQAWSYYKSIDLSSTNIRDADVSTSNDVAWSAVNVCSMRRNITLATDVAWGLCLAKRPNKKYYEEICGRQNQLARCVFGDHAFRFENNTNVLTLAKAVYQERLWQDMPVLADALEEYGLVDTIVLDHCRDQKEHARGCWVVDNILRKG